MVILRLKSNHIEPKLAVHIAQKKRYMNLMYAKLRLAKQFPSFTLGYSVFPIEEHALRPLVPELTFVQEAHFIAK